MGKFRLHTTLRHVFGILGLALVGANSCVGFVLSFPSSSSSSSFSSPLLRQRPLRSSRTRSFLPTKTSTHTNENGDGTYIHLDHIERVLCISDLHTDHAENMQWLANHTSHYGPCDNNNNKHDDYNEDGSIRLTPSDLIVVAGDISHDMDRIEQSLMYLLQTGASVMFVAGNHEAWLHSSELNPHHHHHNNNDNTTTSTTTHSNNTQEALTSSAGMSSLDKLSRVYQTCRELGVYTQTCLKVGGTGDSRRRRRSLWVVPLESWYDGSLSLMECDDLCSDFGKWPWVDFLKCKWPGYDSMPFPNQRIPQGLAQYFATLNQPLLDQLAQWIGNDKNNINGDNNNDDEEDVTIMTVSHFLPNQQCLPDWRDSHSSIFQKDEWLNHGGGGISAKFAKVAGTTLLDKQIRNLLPQSLSSSTLRRLHVFGHSHRPKDFEWKGIRYIHNPLGKPREREIYMVSPRVDFQEVWTRTEGEIQGLQIIRYWEEQGGGVDALILRMNESKKKSRYGALAPSSSTSNDS